jgi:hypothetical protein
MLCRAGAWIMLALSLTALFSCLGKASTESDDGIIYKSMSGYKMKIPSHLILATMQFAEGTDEQDITDFDFVLELPNLDEVITPDQRARLSNPPPPTEGHGFSEEWLTGTMSTSLPAQYGGNYPLDRFNFWRNDVLKDGPYNKVSDELGLNHWTIDGAKYKNPQVLPSSISEFYYSYEHNTLVTCRDSVTIVEPIYKYSICEQYFNIKKYEATVKITYSRMWLKNWKNMQDVIIEKFENLSL